MSGKQFILIGHPVSHSMSPAIHEAAYKGLGVSHHYGLVDCPGRAEVETCVERLRRGEIAGANVTVPYKRLAFELADERHRSAQDTGVANVLSLNAEGKVVASNTDTIALEQELKALAEQSRQGLSVDSTLFSLGTPPRTALVIGAGGAAQAAVVACRNWKIPNILVCRRSWADSGEAAHWDRSEVFEALGARCVAWAAAADACRTAEVIVQATSAGMEGGGPGQDVSSWVPWQELPAQAIAYDVVYIPRITPFLRAAQDAGICAQGGLGMLVRQAAAAVGIWLGDVPAMPPLLAAAQSALKTRGQE